MHIYTCIHIHTPRTHANMHLTHTPHTRSYTKRLIQNPIFCSGHGLDVFSDVDWLRPFKIALPPGFSFEIKKNKIRTAASIAKIWSQRIVMRSWWATLHLLTLLNFMSDLWLAHHYFFLSIISCSIPPALGHRGQHCICSLFWASLVLICFTFVLRGLLRSTGCSIYTKSVYKWADPHLGKEFLNAVGGVAGESSPVSLNPFCSVSLGVDLVTLLVNLAPFLYILFTLTLGVNT